MAESGNPLGRKADKMIRDALLGAARQNPAALKNACEAMWMKAGSGDVAAFNAIADRIDGKPAQAIVGDASQDAVQVNATVTTLTPEQAENMYIAAALKGLVKDAVQ